MPDTLTITQAADLLGVSPDTLRYYEREGLVDVPRRGSAAREYGPAQLERLRFLLVLRGTGMGMAGLREYVALVNQGADAVARRRELLVAHQQAVLARQRELEGHLRAIRDKIERYDGQCGCGTPEQP